MLKKIEKEFEFSRDDMLKIVKDFYSEMNRGLAGKTSSLKMIPTYAGMPTGKEKGRFIALDLGGTNFRVLDLTLKGNGTISLPNIMKFALDKKHITGSAELFFDFLAESVKIFLTKYKLCENTSADLGFTFSFPIQQTGIASGILISWTKGFDVAGVAGSDVVKLLDDAFLRKGIKNINIAVLANDTVGTLVAKSYEDRKCDVGVIIGTGTNACYPEAGTIINIEWGNFNKLEPTSFDRQLDKESNNPGEQILEKMVSGMYLGQIVKRILHDLIGDSPFETEYMSIIEGDKTSDLRAVEGLLERLSFPASSAGDRRMFKKVCEIVSRRAARISASCIAAIVTKMDPHLSKTHVIAIDGSVFERHPTFSCNMEEALKDIFAKEHNRIKLVLSKDGSGIGAAILAAVVANK